jgi:YVTN family beta-propeller protein
METDAFGRVAAGVLLGLAFGATTGLGDEAPASRDRRPVALAFTDGGNLLLVANRGSGTVSVVDVASAKVVAEWGVGRGLADLAPLADGTHLLAVDQDADALILLERRGRTIEFVDQVAVGPDPVRVAVLPGGSSCVVASRWSSGLAFVAILPEAGDGDAPGRLLKVSRTLGLPFRPRELALIRDGSALVVADAFGGRLALVDARRMSLESVRSLPAHNIRGLATSPDGQTLVLAHQTLSRLASSSLDDVHWGSLVNNHLRVLRIDALTSPDPGADVLRGSRLIDLGDVGNAAGDPAGVAFDARGGVMVALSGVGEVAIGPSFDQPLRRTSVGRRPTTVALGPDGETAYVADMLDDTISVVEPGEGTLLRSISLGPRPVPGAVGRGERLFHDARLSHHGWMSCQSCHTDGHTNGRLADTLGDGTYGAAKLVPTLLGVGTTGPWGWTGGVERLEDQVRESIETTMRGAAPDDEQVSDLVAYLRSSEPPPGTPPEGRDAEEAVGRGRAVFRDRGCVDCHAGPAYTSAGQYDVGLSDEVGNRKFNPPSLRGVGRRDRFLHDGRASSLKEVFLDHAHPPGAVLPPGEVADLIAFLKTL